MRSFDLSLGLNVITFRGGRLVWECREIGGVAG